MTGKPVRVFVADDHPLVLRGLRDLIASIRDFEIVGIATDGVQALDSIRQSDPDIAILDLAMPGLRGIEILRQVNLERRSVRIVLLTASIASEEILEAVAAGVFGIQLKENAPEGLIDCLRAVAMGRRWIPTALVSGAMAEQAERQSPSSVEVAQLTGREAEIARLVADGLANKEIARRLDVTEGTVKIHLHNIFKKLQVTNRASLAGLASKWR
jgi:two-component system, NarL family, nitrate/nitrite response regulator NarL